jgi:hypothetical protein
VRGEWSNVRAPLLHLPQCVSVFIPVRTVTFVVGLQGEREREEMIEGSLQT